MFTQSMLLAIIQVLGTFLTLGLKSGSTKRTSMRRTIKIIRHIQTIDIVTSIGFIIYGTLSGTAISAAVGAFSGLINTIVLQSIKSMLQQKYEAIWTIEYYLVLTDKEREKRTKPTFTLKQAVSLYIQYGLEEKFIHEKVQEYLKQGGEVDDSISKDDRVFAGKTINQWKELGHKSKEEWIGTDDKPGKAADLAIGIGKGAAKLTWTISSGIVKGIYTAGREGVKKSRSKERRRS